MSKTELIDQKTVQEDYGILIHTQNTWRSVNRYGWRDITIKLGRLIRYRRSDIESWLESRRLAPPSVAEGSHERRNEGTQLKALQERQATRKTADAREIPSPGSSAVTDQEAPHG